MADTSARREPYLLLMGALTLVTGVADVIGYLRFDQVFTANMTGNVVMLGMVAAGRIGPALGNLVALLGFFAAAFAAGLALRGRAKGWSGAVTGILVVEAVLLIAGGVVMSLIPHGAAVAFGTVLTAVLSAAFGLQAAAAKQVGVADMTTVVVTSTFTGLATGIANGNFRSLATGRRVVSLATMGVGALIGSALFFFHVDGFGVIAAGVLVLLVAWRGSVLSRTIATS